MLKTVRTLKTGKWALPGTVSRRLLSAARSWIGGQVERIEHHPSAGESSPTSTLGAAAVKERSPPVPVPSNRSHTVVAPSRQGLAANMVAKSAPRAKKSKSRSKTRTADRPAELPATMPGREQGVPVSVRDDVRVELQRQTGNRGVRVGAIGCAVRDHLPYMSRRVLPSPLVTCENPGFGDDRGGFIDPLAPERRMATTPDTSPAQRASHIDFSDLGQRSRSHTPASGRKEFNARHPGR
jgi:hypothetical protein